MLLKEDRDTMEIRMLYLICREEYLSALSFGTVRLDCPTICSYLIISLARKIMGNSTDFGTR